MKTGKVWLIGAGPGDPGLLTCRGREILENAEVVVYDRLAGDGVLALMPRNAKHINVGKEGGRHPIPQRQIEKIIVEEALAGNRVVRLKGGDSFLFGRGGEELEALIEHGIPYEVIPGVTSAIAAPECAGIPVTHRGIAQSLHIITAHTREGGIAPQDYEALSKLRGTLLFLMGATAVPGICAGLLDNGYDPATPAAAVEWGTAAHQRTLISTLAELTADAATFGLHSPAIIIVGPVAALARKFAWREKLPLNGLKVLVTRPRKRQGRLSRMLRDAGAEVIEFPVIETVPLNATIPSLDAEWLAFTSATGVETFFDALAAQDLDVRAIGSARIAAIGPTTADALRARGLKTDLVPEVYDSLHLARELADAAAGGRIITFRAQNGSPELGDTLRAAKANFTEIPLYRTETLPAPFAPRDVDAVLFTSASTVRGLKSACPDLPIPLACCIGQQTAAEARRHGITNIRVAAKATLEALIDTLKESR